MPLDIVRMLRAIISALTDSFFAWVDEAILPVELLTSVTCCG